MKITSRSFFSNYPSARSKDSGTTELRFKTAYLSYCPFIKATLISRDAVSRTVSHTPIAMGV